MNGLFWAATALMCIVAFAFVASPFFKTGRHHLVMALGVFVPAVAVSMYALFGSPGVASADSTGLVASRSSTAQAAGASKSRVGSVSSMLEGLEQRLRDEPDDGKSWLLLARSYRHIHRLSDAAEAYAKARALGEYDESFEAPSSDDVGEPESSAKVVGTLSLSAEAASIVKPTDTVFIFARAVGSSGAPAAVLRHPANAFPLEFVLDDTQSMTPSMKLSDLEEVIVTARISRSGNALEGLQKLEAKSDVSRVADGARLNLVIE